MENKTEENYTSLVKTNGFLSTQWMVWLEFCEQDLLEKIITINEERVILLMQLSDTLVDASLKNMTPNTSRDFF